MPPMHTTDSERLKYRNIWAHDDYRRYSPGLAVFPEAYGWIAPMRETSFIDFGCGQGVVADALHERGHSVLAIDIANNAYKGIPRFLEACLWDLPAELSSADHGYCSDVMEHIPTERVDDVLRSVAEKVHVSTFFQIALFDDQMGKLIGQPLHLSVFPAKWWKERLDSVFTKCHFRGNGQYLEALAFT